MMGKGGDPLGLAALLPQLSKQKSWEEKLDLHTVFARWDELLDSDIAAHCRPLKVVKKVLWIEVENSAWLQQLQYQTVQLLDILNQSLSLSRFSGLRFCLVGKEKKEAAKEPALRYVQPPAAEVEAFGNQVASVSDPDAREALMRFWYLSRACKVVDE